MSNVHAYLTSLQTIFQILDLHLGEKKGILTRANNVWVPTLLLTTFSTNVEDKITRIQLLAHHKILKHSSQWFHAVEICIYCHAAI